MHPYLAPGAQSGRRTAVPAKWARGCRDVHHRREGRRLVRRRASGAGGEPEPLRKAGHDSRVWRRGPGYHLMRLRPTQRILEPHRTRVRALGLPASVEFAPCSAQKCSGGRARATLGPQLQSTRIQPSSPSRAVSVCRSNMWDHGGQKRGTSGERRRSVRAYAGGAGSLSVHPRRLGGGDRGTRLAPGEVDGQGPRLRPQLARASSGLDPRDHPGEGQQRGVSARRPRDGEGPRGSSRRGPTSATGMDRDLRGRGSSVRVLCKGQRHGSVRQRWLRRRFGRDSWVLWMGRT